MEIRKWLPLIGITICVFIFNMSEFIPVGLNLSISKDLGISETQTGLVIQIYAWVVALTSFPLVLQLRKVQYHHVLLGQVALFTVFQIMSAMSTDYWMLLTSRIGVAIAHAMFWAIAPPLAVRVVQPRYEKLAISMIVIGTSIQLIIGVPAGRTIGLALGWRTTFMTIGAISVIALAYLLVVFPKVQNPGTFTLKRVPEIFHNKTLIAIYTMLFMFVTGQYAIYSYIEPFFESYGYSPTQITNGMILFGLQGLFGGIFYGKKYEKNRLNTIKIVAICFPLIFFAFRPQAEYFVLAMAVLISWGIIMTIFNSITQNEVIDAVTQEVQMPATSIFSSIYNIGIGFGTILGGIVIDNYGIENIGRIGGFFALIGAIIALTQFIRAINNSKT